MTYDVLYNFISPVTGRILSTPDYVLVGDTIGVAEPSPILIDMRLDIINIRSNYNTLASASFIVGFPNSQLPNAQVLNILSDGYLVNTAGIISTTPTIPLDGLPDLTFNKVWVGNDMNRPTEQPFPSSGSAPADATYILQQENVLLTNAQALVDLGTGMAKIIANGVMALAVAGTDYITPAELNDAINDLQDQIDDLQDQIDDIDDDISVIDGEISAINAELLAIGADILAINAELLALNTAVSAAAALAALAESNALLALAQIAALELNNIPANADVSFYNFKLINLANPLNPQDATTKIYVDNAISGVPSSINITLIGDVTGSGISTSPISTTVVHINPSVISGYPNNTTTFLRGDGAWTNILSGNLALGGASANSLLQFPSVINKRIITLYETANNTNQYFGFGTASGVLIYQVDATTSNHVFYAGTSSATSSVLATIKGTGGIDVASYKLTSVAAPTVSTDGANKAYVDTAVGGIATSIILTGSINGSGVTGTPVATTIISTLDQIPLAGANVNINTHQLINVVDPTTAQAAATKNYVDTRTITLAGGVTGSGALGTSITTTVAICPPSAITGYPSNTTTFLRGDGSWTNVLSGNLGLEGTTPNAPLQFSNTYASRKIVLYQQANNNYQVHSIGTAANLFMFQVASSSTNYSFNVGLNSSASYEVLRITGGGSSNYYGFVGINNSFPNSQLQFAPVFTNRIITLYETANNTNQYFGFGTATNTLVYQVDATTSNHVFYAGTSSTTSSVLATIKGTGGIDVASYKLTSVAAPTVSTDGANKAYVDTAVGGIATSIILTGSINGSGVTGTPVATTIISTLDQIPLAGANVNINTHQLINVVDPTTAQAAATKNYVDTRTITLAGGVTGSGALGTSITTTVAICPPSAITGYPSNTTTFLRGDGSWTNVLSGNLGLLGGTPNGALQFSNSVNLRKIVLYEVANNDYQTYSIGYGVGSLVFTIPGVQYNFSFYAGTSSTTSTFLMSLKGTGNLLLTGNLGISGVTPLSPLQFPNTLNNRIITLYQTTNNAYQYFGFGTATNTLVYQVDATTSNHVFYAGTSSTTSSVLATIKGTGGIDVASYKLTSVAAPTVSTDGANKAYVDTAVGGVATSITLTGNVTGSGVTGTSVATTIISTLDQIPLAGANVNINTHQLINVVDPTTAQAAATKNYVDTRTITLTGGVTGSGALGTSITTTVAVVPVSAITGYPNNTTTFLRGDGAWTNILSGGSAGSVVNLLKLESPRSYGAAANDGVNIIATASNGILGTHDYGAIILGNNPAANDGGAGMAEFRIGGSSSSSSNGRFLYAVGNSSGNVTSVGIWTGGPSVANTVFSNTGVNISGDLVTTGTTYGKKPFANIYMSGNTTTTSTAASAYTKIAGATTTGGLNQYTSPSSNRITYVGTTTINALVTANVSMSFTSSSGNTLGIAIFKNGSLTGATTFVTTTAYNQLQNFSMSAYVSFATNDYVEVWAFTSYASTATAYSLVLSSIAI